MLQDLRRTNRDALGVGEKTPRSGAPGAVMKDEQQLARQIQRETVLGA